MTQAVYTTIEISKQLGVPKHVITYLCNRGLVPHIKRTRLGYRIFTQEQVDLIALLLNMRSAGFTSAELRQYSRLYRQGEATARERLAILITHKHQLQQEIKERQASIDFIERQEELANQKTGYENE